MAATLTDLSVDVAQATTNVIDPPAGGVTAAPLATIVERAPHRYLFIEEVARGGMGVVNRAFDSRLQRQVALKVLHEHALDDRARWRLIREARVMAQLSHPNVVAVYDVEFERDVILVMEYVPGQTLRNWLRSTPRSVAAVIDGFVQAGRGLSAVHRVGILHRDFKPSNVLMGDDGRVRVADFGLARKYGAEEERAHDAAPGAGDSTDVLTTVGQVMGTPLYMAPEQLLGEPLTAAADQYAWCCSLWEALTGLAPYEMAGLRAMAERKRQPPPSWPRAAEAPARIVDALVRGLSPAPRDRWPSMDVLLAEVSGALRPRW